MPYYGDDFDDNSYTWPDHIEHFAQLHIPKTLCRAKTFVRLIEWGSGLPWMYDSYWKTYRTSIPAQVGALEALACKTAILFNRYKQTRGPIVMSSALVLKQDQIGWDFSKWGAFVLKDGEAYAAARHDIRERHDLKPYKDYMTRKRGRRKQINRLILEECELTHIPQREWIGAFSRDDFGERVMIAPDGSYIL